jgi:hypothetical protein
MAEITACAPLSRAGTGREPSNLTACLTLANQRLEGETLARAPSCRYASSEVVCRVPLIVLAVNIGSAFQHWTQTGNNLKKI